MKPPLENMAFSPSRMEALDCPFRFEQLYLKKRSEPAGEMALIGQLFHDWIARYSEKCRDMETEKLRDLSWIKILDQVSAGLDFEGFDRVKQKTFDMIQGLMDDPYWHLPIESFDELFDIEKQWGFQIHTSSQGREYLKPCGWFDPKINMRMIADMIFQSGDTIHVVDHKTGWGEPWEHQLQWYAAGVFSMYYHSSWDRVEVWYHWPGKGGRYEKIGSYSREELPELTDRVIKQIWDARKVSAFLPKQCRACSWCGFKAECPLVAESALELTTLDDRAVVMPITGKFEIIDQGTAEHALRAIVMVGARLEEVENDLKKWVAEHGPVEIGGKRMERRESEKWSCTDADGLITALESDLDITSREIIKQAGISKTLLTKVLRQARHKDDLENMMQSYGKSETVLNDPRIYKGGGDE